MCVETAIVLSNYSQDIWPVLVANKVIQSIVCSLSLTAKMQQQAAYFFATEVESLCI